MTPQRVQLSRTKGWRMPANTVKVDRTTKWGNIFVPGKPAPFVCRVVEDKRHAASLYHGFAPQNEKLVDAARAELVGRNLACWCQLCDAHAQGRALGVDCPFCEPCHVDTLLRLANA